MANPRFSAKPALRSYCAKSARIVRLAVSTEACPDVVSHVLDTLARQAVIPWGIDFRRTSRGLSLVVEVENFPGVDELATRIEILAMVRKVCVFESLTAIALDHG